MDEVVAADCKTIAVATHLPYGHFRIGNLEAGGHCGCASVNGMETIGIHVVRQTRATSNTGNHGSLVRGHREFGHRLVEGVEDSVVAASRTPAHRLVAFIVGCFEKGFFHGLVFLHNFCHFFGHFAGRERLSLYFVDSADILAGETALKIVGEHASI